MNLEKDFVKKVMRSIAKSWRHGKLQPKALAIMAANVIMVDKKVPDAIWEKWAEEVLEGNE